MLLINTKIKISVILQNTLQLQFTVNFSYYKNYNNFKKKSK